MASGTVLAATVTIVFEGLLVFVGPSEAEKTRVVVVDGTKHHPAHDAEIFVNGKPIRTIQKNDRISFDLGTGARTTTKFNDKVPTLSKYIRKDDGLLDEVKNGTPHTSVLAYVDLPAGELTPEQFFPRPARFHKPADGSDVLCVASQVVLQRVDSPDSYVMTITPEKGDPIPFPLKATDSVRISNTTNFGGGHLFELTRVLFKKRSLGEIKPLTVGPLRCDENGDIGRPRQSSSATPQVYLLAPNGDCGPPDYP